MDERFVCSDSDTKRKEREREREREKRKKKRRETASKPTQGSAHALVIEQRR